MKTISDAIARELVRRTGIEPKKFAVPLGSLICQCGTTNFVYADHLYAKPKKARKTRRK